MVEIASIVQTGFGAVAGVALSLNDTWQAVVGDRIAVWRLTNAAKLQQKVKDELAAAGVKLDASRVPDRYAFAWFEEATKQDEDEIQNLFARLIAQAAAGNEDASDRRHLEIVSRLTPPDAMAFQAMYREADHAKFSDQMFARTRWRPDILRASLERIIGNRTNTTIEHLINIGLLRWISELDKRQVGGAISRSLAGRGVPDFPGASIRDLIGCTSTGISLYRALALSAVQQPSAEK